MRKIAVFAFLLCLAAATTYADTIDQNQPSHSIYMAGLYQSGLAQSFQQSSGYISGAGIFLFPGIGTTGNVVISLYDALPNNSGHLMASGTALGTQGNWVDVFWTPVSVTSGASLYLVLSGNISLGLAGEVNDPYPNGQVYANGFNGGGFTDFDFAFRTYTASSPVPEPAAMLLLGSGLIGLFVYGRKRLF